MLTRRSMLLAGVAAPLGAALGEAQPVAWPSGPIRIVVPFAAGGSIDMIARVVQPVLQQRLGNTIIVDNRPGASGSTGAAMVAKSPPDGATWLLCFDSQALNPFLVPNLPFDAEKDFSPVLLIGTGPHVIATHPSRPYRTFADVVADAKARPGVITCSNGGAGSLAHLTAVMLAKRAGIQLVHVPYRGGGPSLNDAVAGHVDLISSTAAVASAQLQAGALHPLLQTGRTRLAGLSNVPTAIEAGFTGFEALTWWGCFGPPNLPQPILDRFGGALADTLRDPPVAERLTETLQINFAIGGPDQLRSFLAEQMRTWGAAIRENEVTAQ